MEKSQKCPIDDELIILLVAIVGGLCFLIHGVTMEVMEANTKPNFSLQGATVHNFSLTATALNLLTTNITVTLAARIPYKHRDISYEYLFGYATYGDRQITIPTPLPASYQSYQDVAVWSLLLGGVSVPLEPDVAIKVEQEQNVAGKVSINIVVLGWIRKAVLGMERTLSVLYVSCPAYLSFGSDQPENIYHVEQSCGVDVKETDYWNIVKAY